MPSLSYLMVSEDLLQYPSGLRSQIPSFRTLRAENKHVLQFSEAVHVGAASPLSLLLFRNIGVFARDFHWELHGETLSVYTICNTGLQ